MIKVKVLKKSSYNYSSFVYSSHSRVFGHAIVIDKSREARNSRERKIRIARSCSMRIQLARNSRAAPLYAQSTCERMRKSPIKRHRNATRDAFYCGTRSSRFLPSYLSEYSWALKCSASILMKSSHLMAVNALSGSRRIGAPIHQQNTPLLHPPQPHHCQKNGPHWDNLGRSSS